LSFFHYWTFQESTASNQMKLDSYNHRQKCSSGTLVLHPLRVSGIAKGRQSGQSPT